MSRGAKGAKRSRRATGGRRAGADLRSRSARSGPSGLLPAALILSLVVLGWVGTPAHRRPSLSVAERLPQLHGLLSRWRGGEAEEVAGPLWIEPSALAGATPEQWGWPRHTDERWAAELDWLLANTPDFVVGDGQALADLGRRFEALSFVKSVPVLEADRERGLVLELELRRPVACLPVGLGFLSVDDEGVLLSGPWPSPVHVAGAPLPVIGPLADADGLFAEARPGDWLSEPEHLDALDVALSLGAHLDLASRQRLGRIVIDAREARRASVTEPGIRLLLEERRLVLFGRQPSTPEPGELCVERKWDSVRRALAPLADAADGFDWDVVDVRWDQPAFVPRLPSVAWADDVTTVPARAF